VVFQVSGQTTVPAGRYTYYTIFRPDGSVLNSVATSGGATLNLPNLPATGTYLLFVDPGQGETSSMQLLVGSGVTGGQTANGASGSYATTVAGQNTYLTFTATAGQNLGLALSELVTPNATASVYMHVHAPDGSYVAGADCYASNDGCQVNIGNTVAGSYSVIIEAPYNGDRTMSFKSTLSTDVVNTLSINATKTVNLSRRGQNGRLTFSGTAGQTVVFQVSGQTTVPAGRYTYYTIFRPDGSYLSGTSVQTSAMLNLPALPDVGTYTVFVDPSNGETLNSQVLVSPAN
jgi:hypothetical protein